MKRYLPLASLALAFALSACGGGAANNANTPAPANTPADNQSADKPDKPNEPDKPSGTAASRDALVAKAWDFLKTQYNTPPKPDDREGILAGWGRKSMNIPYTAMVLQGVVGTKVWEPEDPMIKDSVEYLLENQFPTGAWSVTNKETPGMAGRRAVYCTAIVAELFAELNATDGPWKGKLRDQIVLARDYLKQSQVGNAEGPLPDYEVMQPGYGGWAYSREELDRGQRGSRPPANMSTTAFAIDALKACGLDEDDPAWGQALTFLRRNQNAGEVQDEGFAAMAEVTIDGVKEKRPLKPAAPGSPDHGGAMYSEETSMADGMTVNEDGSVTLHSYGSMTYNLLRSYLFAGLKKDSMPVRLAFGWIQRNYTFEKVPGFRNPEQFDMGLYYYFLSMAKTLNAWGEDTIEEPERGMKHNWREDLTKALAARQTEDGSWVNKHNRWNESSKVLCTAYVLCALQQTRD
jgi:squalene-hopene/tetraprenyl-beta-curcumene cyclase